MRSRKIAGLVAGAAIALGIVAPALGAADPIRRVMTARSFANLDDIAGFTPASIDPRLGRLLGKTALVRGGLRFTPGEAAGRSAEVTTITVTATRKANNLVLPGAPRAALDNAPGGESVKVAPISYNLGGSVGLKRLALPAEVAASKVDSVPLGIGESFDLAQTKSSRRPSKLRSVADLPVTGGAQLAGDSNASTALDVAGAYRLTRNLDITAGVRYRNDAFRIDRPASERADSQAVFVGTALRF